MIFVHYIQSFASRDLYIIKLERSEFIQTRGLAQKSNLVTKRLAHLLKFVLCLYLLNKYVDILHPGQYLLMMMMQNKNVTEM